MQRNHIKWQKIAGLSTVGQLFSHISVALAKKAVTLPDSLRVIQSAYSLTPITHTVENIYDVKAWLQQYTSTFKHYSHLHAFRFKLNDDGDVAKAGRKEWLQEERPFVILANIPPGKPSVLKPDLTKCPSIRTMKDSVEKFKIRMSMAERGWWQKNDSRGGTEGESVELAKSEGVSNGMGDI